MNKLALLFLFVTISATAQPFKPEIAFTVAEKDLIPEGIAYDSREKAFYLSSIYKKKIVRISAKGEVRDFIASAADGVEEVLGMKVDQNGLLWACNNTPEHDTMRRISNVHVYDTRNRSLYKRFQVTDGRPHLFNDLYITKAGDVYITDTQAGMLWVIRKGGNDIEAFTKPGSLAFPNGITATEDESKILVATGSALGVVSIDMASRSINPLRNDRYLIIGLDGLYRHKHSLIGVQNTTFPEAIISMTMTPGGNGLGTVAFIAHGHPAMDTPTTGVIVGDEFYFIANSQLLQIMGTGGKIKDVEKLNESVIMKIKLE
ncbi:MAG TPA: SMP-30/gluconolactonase/LRE family protein [Ohtaekwangia sp.]|nr:SMP-30/gluconolactonase/LRE family protein [Ohtaekwangia sp.]